MQATYREPDRPVAREGGAIQPIWLGRPAMVAAAVYLAAGIFAFWPAWVHGPSRTGTASRGDLVMFYWFLAHAAASLPRLTELFFTHSLAWPHGVNLLANTSVPLLGIIAAPLTLASGPVASLDVLGALGIATSSFSAYVLARRWAGYEPAALLAGFVYLLAGGLVSSAAFGHLMMLFAVFQPLMLLVADQTLRLKRGDPVRMGFLLGVLAIAQFFVSTEVLAQDALVGALCLAACLALFPHASRDRAALAVKFFGTAAGTTLVVLGYPMWYAVDGPGHVTGLVHPHLTASGVHLPGVVFPKVTPASPFLCHLVGYCGPTGSPGGLGLPLIAVLVASVWLCRRLALARFALAMALVCFVMSLGARPYFHATGKPFVAFPLPFALLDHLPVLDNMGPMRFDNPEALFIGLLVAMGVARLAGRGVVPAGPSPSADPSPSAGPTPSAGPSPSMTGVIAMSVVVLALVPIFPPWPYHFTSVTVPEFFTSPALAQIPPGSPVLTYPFPSNGDANLPWDAPMLWQAAGNFRFRLIGGYVMAPSGPTGRATFSPQASSTVSQLFQEADFGVPAADASRSAIGRVRAELARWNVSVVLVQPGLPGSTAAAAVVTRALGKPARGIGGMEVWYDVQGALLTRQR